MRILKQRHFDWSKLTVVFNNVVNSSKITTKKLIREGLTYYVDATNTYTEELERISRYTEIPLNPINYSVYIDAMDKGRIPYDNFTPEFKTAMDTLSKMVYGILGEKRKKSIFG